MWGKTLPTGSGPEENDHYMWYTCLRMLAEALLLAGSFAAAALALACYLGVRGSMPLQLTNTQKGIAQLVDQVIEEQGRHGAKMVAWREDIEGVLEAVESTLDRVETKRRSAAASASRIAGAQGQAATFDPNNREHLKQRARELGHSDVM